MGKYIRGNINMRQHLAGLIHGDKYNIAYGHWIIYREYDHSQESVYWNENLGEAIEGPKFKYTDYIIRTRRYRHGLSQGGTQQGLDPLLEGIMEPYDYLYYIEYSQCQICDKNNKVSHLIDVKVQDVLYEIDKFEGETKPRPPYDLQKKMEIKVVEPVLGDHGRIEYYIVVAKDATTRW